MARNDKLSPEDAQKLLEANRAQLKKISVLLKIFGISLIVTLASLVGYTSFYSDFFLYVLIIAVLAAFFSSFICASATGHGMISLETLGREGGGDLLALPIIFIGNAFFTLAGWAYGLKEKSTLQKENERLLAIISKASAEK